MKSGERRYEDISGFASFSEAAFLLHTLVFFCSLEVCISCSEEALFERGKDQSAMATYGASF